MSVYLEQSIGASVPLFWRAARLEYSLALPSDTEMVAIRVDAETKGALALRVPLRGLVTALAPGQTSAYVAVQPDEALELRLDLGGQEYALRVVRSRIRSSGEGRTPDPARTYPPQGTLAGLNLWDSMGLAASMAWFMPRVSLYVASIREDAHGVRLAATPNDPDAELEWRFNGGKWDFLVSGLTSSPAEVAPYGWTLLEVRVSSFVQMEPLVYQVVLARGGVCHPSCSRCGQGGCQACTPPLVLVGSKCLYTTCSSSSVYFNKSTEGCEPCDSSCLECIDGTARGCLKCPASKYLRPASPVAIAGACQSCMAGYFVHPSSQRCQLAPADLQAERFYLRLALRVSVEDFLENAETLKTVLRKSAETLAVSSQDVRFHRWDSAKEGLGVNFFLEVENPFVQHRNSEEWFNIDEWFASLPVPVDEIRILTQSQLYPAAPPALPSPFLDPFMWGVIGAGSASVLLIYPLYNFYFVRKYRQQQPYPVSDGQELFVDQILERTDPVVMSAMVHSKGNLKAAAGDD
ncbi:unnamed protein product [Effrenium voratum]|uniref:Uncharacterized protein n=1 Tax=Effrenium voratum TaxID=2562239 RepID=A0AA36I894_9DINO|nr:unnamed protein product [Effrenium voratum]